MDAVHLMRAITGRDLIIKVEGCYHGHHDSVQVSVCPDPARTSGPAERPTQRRRPAPASPRRSWTSPWSSASTTSAAWPRLLDEHPGQVAGMILEPIMMNAGIITPEPGYLAGLKDLLHAHGALPRLRRGQDRADGRAGRRHRRSPGSRPTSSTLAKAIGGGVAVAAVGGTQELMAHVADGDYEMVGTFNGNPLAMAAARAMLCEVATPEAYERIERLRAAGGHRGRAGDRPARPGRAGGVGRRQGLRGVQHRAGPRLPRLPGPGRRLQPRALAVPAQRRGVPAALGQDRAVADLGSARRVRHRPVRG